MTVRPNRSLISVWTTICGPLEDSLAIEHKVDSRLLLEFLVRPSAAVLELLASEDHLLLVQRDGPLVLDQGLKIIDCVISRIEWCLACEGLDNNSATTAEPEHKRWCQLLVGVLLSLSTLAAEHTVAAL